MAGYRDVFASYRSSKTALNSLTVLYAQSRDGSAVLHLRARGQRRSFG